MESTKKETRFPTKNLVTTWQNNPDTKGLTFMEKFTRE